MLLKISVTRADIKAGNDQCSTCPVALAGTRALREAGFPNYRMEYEPYRAFGEPEGITVWNDRYTGKMVAQVPAHIVDYSAHEFASMFDDWFRNGRRASARKDIDRPMPFEFEVELAAD